jgi:hypothetical protein
MRADWTLALALLACGGRLSSQPEIPSDGGARAEAPTSRDSGAERADTGAESADAGADQPIDASGLPLSFAMNCAGSSPIAFQLPCAIGVAPLNVTECYALGDTERRLAVFQFMVPLGYMAAHRNQPIDLGTFPPGGPNPAAVKANGVVYVPTLRGTLTVSQVSTTERAYAGRLQSVEFTGSADGGGTIVCSGDAPFWTIAGGFL